MSLSNTYNVVIVVTNDNEGQSEFIHFKMSGGVIVCTTSSSHKPRSLGQANILNASTVHCLTLVVWYCL